MWNLSLAREYSINKGIENNEYFGNDQSFNSKVMVVVAQERRLKSELDRLKNSFRPDENWPY